MANIVPKILKDNVAFMTTAQTASHYAKKVQHLLPLDSPNQILYSITVDGDALISKITLTEIDEQNLNEYQAAHVETKVNLSASVKTSVCAGKDMKGFIDGGGTSVIEYYTNDGALYDIVTLSDCKPAAAA